MKYTDEDIDGIKQEIAALGTAVETLLRYNRNRRENISQIADAVGDIYDRLKNVELTVFPNLQSDIQAVNRIVSLDPDGPEEEKRKP